MQRPSPAPIQVWGEELERADKVEKVCRDGVQTLALLLLANKGGERLRGDVDGDRLAAKSDAAPVHPCHEAAD